jgi:hypothetical protein
MEKKEYKKLLDIPELKELDNLLNMPCLFLTFTMGRDSPLNTVLKYKNNWKNFYNNLKHLSKKYGFNLDYFIKGIEFTKKSRLHIHLLILGVDMPINSLIDFKKDVENILNLAGFGFINDVMYLKGDKTYIMKSKKDLKYYYTSDKYKNIKILKKFKLKYDNNKYASFNLVELEYVHKKEFKINKSSKIINYVFKYILKSDSYDTITDDNQKRHFLKYNVFFWLSGVKKFNISRKLSNLLKTFDNIINQKRYLFFDSVSDAKAFICNKLKDAGASFDRLFINDDLIKIEFDTYKLTLYGLYKALGLNLTDFMLKYRFKSYSLDYYKW